jgi:putative proteasome-type protease
MTYCVGLLVNDGLVMIADTRTNAGVDNISTYRKLHVFEEPGRRVLALATAGSLSVTQTAMSLLQEGVLNPDSGLVETLEDCTSVFRAAQLVGHALRKVRHELGPSMQAESVSYDATILLGGQMIGGPLQLFMVYGVGNFIECSNDTPYLQIGEHKYGKPILDRSIRFDTPLADVLKIGLISFTSTMRSNLAVGLPLDLIVIRRGSLDPAVQHRIGADDPYFSELGEQWSAALNAAHQAIAPPPYG